MPPSGGAAGVHIARHAEERHHQAVEVPPGSCRGRAEQVGEGQVDLIRGDQVRRQAETARVGVVRAVLHVEADREEDRGAGIAAVVGQVAGVDAPRNPLFDHTRSDDPAHLFGGVSCGVHARDDRTHRGSRHVVDRNAALFECLQYADMVKSFGSAAAHDHPDALGRCRKGEKHSRREKREEFPLHILIFLLTLPIKPCVKVQNKA